MVLMGWIVIDIRIMRALNQKVNGLGEFIAIRRLVARYLLWHNGVNAKY